MSNYVATYRRLDDNAARAEAQADHDRWEQCRVAHEAVESGEYSRLTFGKAVNKSDREIGRQIKMWLDFGDRTPAPDGDRPTYTEAYAAVQGRPTGAERTEQMTREGINRMSVAERARLVAEQLEDEEVAEEVEEMQLSRRGPIGEPLPEPETVGRRGGNKMAREMKTDLATGALRNAAGSLAEAILCKEEFGIEHPDQEAEALSRIERYLAAYKGGGHVSDDDRSWLESIGVEL